MCYLGEMEVVVWGGVACVHPNLCTAARFQCSPTLQALPKSNVLEGSRKGGRMKEK